MKIGILTASRTDNNGTDLQALAMQNLFYRMGAKDVEIIDYICNKIDTSRCIKINAHNLFYLPVILYNRYAHRKFRKLNFKKSEKTYNADNLHTVPYNTIVVGSDQIWNLDLTGNDLSFYLPFTNKNVKKYAYAASLGTAKTEKWEKKHHIKDLLCDFTEISVRETTGVNALSQIGIKSQHDLDPILMGRKEDWLQFITPAIRKRYILLYLVGYNPMAIEYAQILAKRKGLDVIMLNPGIKNWKGVKRYPFVSVEKWLNLIANADYVITNSYHGLSFAVLFHREFRLCLLPLASKNNSRMVDLLNALHLSENILRAKTDTFEPINWEIVDANLSKLVDRSEQYIKLIINNSECH